MKTKQQRLLFLAVLSQCLIDNIEDGIGEFKKADKSFAKTFIDRLLAIMNKDFGSSKAVDQLIDLTLWIEDMFYIMIQMGEIDEQKTKEIQDDWEKFLSVHELKTLKR